MPELPEVETIARTLTPQVEGRRIVACQLLNRGSLDGKLPLPLATGGRLGKAGRRGKLLLLPLAFPADEGFPDLLSFRPASRSDGTGGTGGAGQTPPDKLLGLGIHLKMTGRLFVHPEGHEAGPHTRVIFDLDDGTRLFFDDSRKFGRVRLLSPAVLAAWPYWQSLGPEPLEVDADTFASRFAGRFAPIKQLLLDQKVLAGCGNIYADESLFRAGIRPETRASALSPARLEALRLALQEVLRESIAACGSSIRDYRTANGDAGAFQNRFRVYGRAGQTCLVCGKKLEGCRIAGRGTVFCPRCQR